jgi:hypothetical protein
MMDLIALVESIVYAPYGGKPSEDEGVMVSELQRQNNLLCP